MTINDLRRMFRASCYSLMVLTLSAGVSHADMSVDRNVFYFEPGQPPRADLQVSNPGDENLYIQVEVLAVTAPGTPAELRTAIDNPREAGFLVTPNKFVVPPGTRKLVRLVNLGGHSDSERVFRVNLTPAPAPMKAHASGIRVIVAQQLLAIVAPQNPAPDLVAARDGQRLILENRGNANIMLRSGRECQSEAALATGTTEACAAISGRRLYPGNVWNLDLAYSGPVEFVLTQANASSRKRF